MNKLSSKNNSIKKQVIKNYKNTLIIHFVHCLIFILVFSVFGDPVKPLFYTIYSIALILIYILCGRFFLEDTHKFSANIISVILPFILIIIGAFNWSGALGMLCFPIDPFVGLIETTVWNVSESETMMTLLICLLAILPSLFMLVGILSKRVRILDR